MGAMQQDIGKLMRDAQQSLQKMQKDMARVQAELAEATVEGSAGGGAVVITSTGAGVFKSVKIKPEAVDPQDVETLEDLVLTAVQDASQKVQSLMSDKTGAVTRGMNLPP